MGNQKELIALTKKFNAVTKYIPATDLLGTFKVLGEAYKENQKTILEIERINANKEYLLKEMNAKYELYYKVFAEIFSERRGAIDKSFEIIDKGLKENDKTYVELGLNSLSKVVASSPFSNLTELSKLLESGGTIEI